MPAAGERASLTVESNVCIGGINADLGPFAFGLALPATVLCSTMVLRHELLCNCTT